MKWPAPDQVQAVLRHVYTATSAVTVALVVVGISQQDATTIGTAVHAIGDGTAALIAGVGMLVPVYSSVKAFISASRANRMKAMDADPQIKKVETVPGTDAHAEAAAIPGNKVV